MAKIQLTYLTFKEGCHSQVAAILTYNRGLNMHKRGSSGVDFSITTTRDGSRSFGDHDDRWVPRGKNNRRNFKHKGHGKGGRSRGGSYRYNADQRTHMTDQEGDTVMEGDAISSRQRYNPYGSRPKSRRGRRDNNQDHAREYHAPNVTAAIRMGLPVSNKGKTWYKISIPNTKQIDKAVLLSLLGNHTPGPLSPIEFHYEGQMAVFHLKDRDIAESLRKINKTITMPNSNFKIPITVSLSGPPLPTMDEAKEQSLKTVMSQRYDPSVKMLDLSFLYNDPGLVQQDIYLALNRHCVMASAIKIIKENIPELAGLNLSNNRLLSLSSLQDLVSKAPCLISLNLSCNQLRDLTELEKLKGWQLQELVLTGNVLCNTYRDKPAYISAVRKIFPKVTKLDGNDLPPPITFDVERAVIPPSKGSYFVNDEIQDLVVKFLKEYYTLYDSDNRQPLIDAYHEHAVFSLTANYNETNDKQASLKEYLLESRNSLRKKGSDQERARQMDRLLKRGRLPVVSQLYSLSRTTHDASSFIVDVNFVSSSLLSFTVNGLFKETDNKADKPPIRAFSRVFVTVPAAAGGILVTNDMLTITNATPEQTQAAFKNTGPTPSSSPVSSNPPPINTLVPPPSTSGASLLPASVATPESQQQMILAFSQNSGMNVSFSQRCLVENGWNFEKAAEVFTTLNSQGKIPPEAFLRT
ncbi:nuclear RNA export factor 1-like isoform X1 [Pomacea canaliculata]|uniref:nuclear RNA export factor 1-like isoform X1 n=1 Tax=Pomacea canaliculata TaxID=400727 RepID=UPI000D736BBE|nr:nuclear RNA export factor 1-like isoform X1 [Pomacea canaliculata]